MSWVCQPNKNKTAQNANINIQQLQNENFLSLEKISNTKLLD